jgi:cytochrome b561
MKKSYPTPLLAVHWLVAAAVLLAYVTGGNPAKAQSAFDVFVSQVHVASGLSVATLLLLRVPLRLLLGAPEPEPAPRWQLLAAKAAYVALYGLMVLVPLAGWAALAHKDPNFLLFGWALPLPDDAVTWVRLLGKAHETLGNVFIWVAGVHAAAALLHHFVMHDNTLRRMLPWGC